MKTPDNPQLQLAHDFVQYTNNNIFLTGKAGTGKTTFLHNLKKISPKRMVVVAPTGVAAINAGGVTIHSFFQLSFGPQVPGYEHEDSGSRFKRFSKEKRDIMKSLDLLVIDEISMVRADMLDSIDNRLRRFKNPGLPFGGVQLLMIGDLQQLAPVVKEDEWKILKDHYKTAFFFSSKALKETSFVNIELKHVYRQSDQAFIELLNKVRDNKMDQEVINFLNQRYQPGFETDEKGYITLTTHNAKARNINESRLNRLKGEKHKFMAEIKGNFPEYNYPTDEELIVKEGAQVMFVKNDPSPSKQFFNGKIGKITGFEDEHVIVHCPGEKYPITVEPLEWQNVKYSLDRQTKEITEEVEGSFVQIPLKLAWAITIHKSQGLTFDKAIIDAQAAFAHGQVYVALSRCRSLEGLVLSSRIGHSGLKSHSGIQSFTQYVENNQPGPKQLEESRLIYQKQLLDDLFDFQALIRQLYHINNLISRNAFNLPVSLREKYHNAARNFKKEVAEVSEKFKNEIGALMKSEKDAEKNLNLQQRITRAVGYFDQKLKENIISLLDNTEIETDNKTIKKSISEALENLHKETLYKQKCLQACKKGFMLKDYLHTRAKASIDDIGLKQKKKMTDYGPADVSDAELYNLLKGWRDAKAKELGWEVFMVLPLKAIRGLCVKIPSNKKALMEVKGFGKKKLETFGDELLELLIEYRRDHDMEVLPPEDPVIKPKKPKKDTRLESYKLWKEGKNIAEIAAERNLKDSTIESHLATYVEKGEIEIHKLVSPEKIKSISGYFLKSRNPLLGEAKSILGDEVSYGELKLVFAHLVKDGKMDKPAKKSLK